MASELLLGVKATMPLRKPAGRAALAAALSNSAASSARPADRTNASLMTCSAFEDSIISRVSTLITASLYAWSSAAVAASWRTGIGLPSATKLALLPSATKPGALTLPTVSSVRTSPSCSSSAPADAAPSASSSSRTTRIASSAAHPVVVVIAGDTAARITRSLGQRSAATFAGGVCLTLAITRAASIRIARFIGRSGFTGGSGTSRLKMGRRSLVSVSVMGSNLHVSEPGVGDVQDRPTLRRKALEDLGDLDRRVQVVVPDDDS